MRAIVITNPGPNSTLSIKEVKNPKPGPHELLVNVKATALNRADLFQRVGNYPPPEGAPNIPGLEMSGIVEKTGIKVTNREKGERVFGLLPGGGYAEYVVIHEQMAMSMPDSMSFIDAAAIPETFLTAYQSLCWLGKLKKNENVLIHAGGSGVGTSAIQIARQFDARIATTAGSDEKLKKTRLLGAKLTINYKKEDFSQVIENEWGAQNVDLILDFIGRPYWHSNIKVLAMDGRLVYLAFLGGKNVDRIDLSKILYKRLSIKGSTLRNRDLSYKINLTREFLEFAIDYLRDKTLTPVIDSTYDWTEVEQAHQRMQKNQNTGKIVLTGM